MLTCANIGTVKYSVRSLLKLGFSTEYNADWAKENTNDLFIYQDGNHWLYVNNHFFFWP